MITTHKLHLGVYLFYHQESGIEFEIQDIRSPDDGKLICWQLCLAWTDEHTPGSLPSHWLLEHLTKKQLMGIVENYIESARNKWPEWLQLQTNCQARLVDMGWEDWQEFSFMYDVSQVVQGAYALRADKLEQSIRDRK